MKQSDLLRKQADIMDMAEKYGIDDWTKLVKIKEFDSSSYASGNITRNPLYPELEESCDYDFALGVVEGKPVFEGDVLWDVFQTYFHFKAAGAGNSFNHFVDTEGEVRFTQHCSWSPPKPKTVMVELTIEAAKIGANFHYAWKDIGDACRKALEDLK